MVELVQELEATGINTPFMKVTIEEAKRGEYHDFKNKKYICGKVALVERLGYMGLEKIAGQVMDGEYDETPDAEDKEEMRKTMPQGMWKALGLEPKQAEQGK